jgi:hypothetical protein
MQKQQRGAARRVSLLFGWVVCFGEKYRGRREEVAAFAGPFVQEMGGGQSQSRDDDDDPAVVQVLAPSP